MIRKFKFYGYLFLLVGTLFLVQNFAILSFNLDSIIGSILAVVGLRLFYNYYGSEERIIFIIGTIIFFYGILIFVSSEYRIQIHSNLILSTLFLSLSIVFLFLFLIDKSSGLLVISIGLMFSCVLFVLIELEFIKSNNLPYFINNFEITLSVSILLVLIGVIKILKLRKKSNLFT
jgi:hypothetical protein